MWLRWRASECLHSRSAYISMSLYPEVFSKTHQDKGTSPEPLVSPQIRPNVKIKAVHSLPAPIQIQNISKEASSPQNSVIRIPGPPLSANLLYKLDKSGKPQDRRVGFNPPTLKQQPLRAVLLKSAEESATFENEEIRDKVRAAEPDHSARQQQMKRAATAREKQRTEARPASKPLTMRRLLRIREPRSQSTTGSALITPSAPVAPAQTKGVRYVLGEAQMPPQFALPLAYCQTLGHPVAKTEIKEVIWQIVGRLFKHVGKFRLSQQGETADFYALSLGEWAPVSECCGAALLVQLCRQAGGKVLCTARQCYIRHLHNFLLSVAERERLWSEAGPQSTESRSKAVSMEIQKGSYRSRSLRAQRPQSERPTPSPQLHNLVFTNEKLRHLRTGSNVRPFDLKDCLTFQPPAAPRAFSPLRLLLARGGRRAGLAHSLEELEAVWTGLERG